MVSALTGTMLATDCLLNIKHSPGRTAAIHDSHGFLFYGISSVATVTTCVMTSGGTIRFSPCCGGGRREVAAVSLS